MISVNEAIFSAQGADNKEENVHRDLWVQRKEKLILFHKLKEGLHIESYLVWSFFDWMNNYQRAEESWEHCVQMGITFWNLCEKQNVVAISGLPELLQKDYELPATLR